MKITITLTPEQIAGLWELIELAHRGWGDYQYQASYGDYTEAQIKTATEHWEHAKEVAEALRNQIHRSSVEAWSGFALAATEGRKSACLWCGAL